MVTHFFRRFILLITLCLICDIPVVYAAENNFNVLYLNSYHHGYSWSDDIERGLRQGLNVADKNINIYSEYLDTKRFPQATHLPDFATALANKYADFQYDLVIASDNNAVDFALAYRSRLFPDLPLIFCGYNHLDPTRFATTKAVTGINETVDYRGTLELALQLHPQTRQIIWIVSDFSTTTAQHLAAVEQLLPNYRSRYQVELLKNLPLQVLTETVAALPTDSIVIIAGDAVDMHQDNFLSFQEYGRRIAAASRVPVYSMWDFYLDTGVVGGSIVTGVEQGRATAELLALPILLGKPVDELAFILNSPAINILDYQAMQRFHIDAQRVPAGSEIINQPPNFYELHREAVWSAIIVIITLILAVLTSIWMLRRLHRQNLLLQQQEAIIREHQATLEQQVEERTRALQKSQQDLEEAQRVANLGSWQLDITTGILTCSTQTYRIIKIAPGTALTMADFLACVHPEDRERVAQARQNALHGNLYEIEHRIIANDTVAWVIEKAAVHFAAGEPVSVVGTIFDISARKQVEQELLHSESRFRAFFEKNSSVMLLIDPASGQLVNANTAAVRYYGYSLETLLTMSINQINTLPPEQIALERQHALHEERNYFNFRHRLANGEIRDVEVYSTPIENEGRLLLFSIIHDISKRKSIEADLRASESRNRALIEVMGEGLVMQNRRGEIIACNQAAERILGLSQTQMLGRNALNTRRQAIREDGSSFPSEHHPGIIALRTGQAQRNIVMGIHKPDNSLSWILVNAEPMFDINETSAYAVVVTFSDITETRNAHAELDEQRRILQAVLDNTPVAIQMYDLNGTLLLSNQVAEQLLHGSKDNVPLQELNRNYHAFVYGTETLYPTTDMPLVRSLKGETCRIEDMELRYSDGSRILLEVSAAPVSNENGDISAAVIVFQDINARKQAELALIDASQKAEAANRAKSSFLANMSHELRTPLNAVMGYAQILSQSPALDTEHQRMAAIIKNSGEHLLSLLNDILDLSKIEAGRYELLFAPCRLDDFLNSLVDIFGVHAERKGLIFKQDFAPDLPMKIETDGRRLRQILMNLLGNAVKFTQQGYVALRCQYSHGYLHFTVSDTGIGISPEQQDLIFEAFQQVSDDALKSQGTGLGLSISRKLTDLLQGTLSVESELGQGSHFHLKIPVSVQEGTYLSQTQLINAAEVMGYTRCDGQQAALHILIVEDMPENQNLLFSFLSPLGFDIYQANSGEACLEYLREHTTDLILMDIKMAGIDGLETTRRIRAQSMNMPIIAVTAYAFEEDRAQAMQAGCNDYLSKPIAEQALLDALAAFLPLQWQTRQIEEKPSTAQQRLATEDYETLLSLVQKGAVSQFVSYINALPAIPETKSELNTIRALAESFNLLELKVYLEKALAETQVAETHSE
jgi:PAS domain S-box-containing protein